MSLKSDLKALADFSDNPYDAKYRPEREMKRLYALLMVTLPIFLGFFCQFYVLVSGPIFIYWIIIFVRALEYWKALNWKKWKYFVPMIPVLIFGLYLSYTQYLVTGIGYIINNFIFYK